MTNWIWWQRVWMSGVYIMLLSIRVLAQTSYPLEKVGIWEDETDLAFYYAFYASPLIIINTTVYVPHAKCIELRGYGGTYTTKDIEGNMVVKSEGGDAVEKEMEGTADEKTAAGDEAKKSRWAEMEQKDQSGLVEQRQQEEENIQRTGDGSGDMKQTNVSESSKQMAGDEAERFAEGDLLVRSGAATGDQKTYGAFTLFIRCVPNKGKMDLAHLFDRGPVHLYDIHGLKTVSAVDISYEE